MKIPTSSSILLATLAMSSSSSCLAAPAGGAHQDTGMTSSSSNNHMPSTHGPHVSPAEMSVQARSEPVDESTVAYPGRLEARDPNLKEALGTLESTVQRIIGIISGTSPKARSLDADGANANGSIDPQYLPMFHSAVADVYRYLNADATSGLPVPSPAQSVPGTAISALPLNNKGSSSSPAAPAAAAVDDGSTPNAASSATSSSAPASASSPPMPVNPPNTPSLPINPPA